MLGSSSKFKLHCFQFHTLEWFFSLLNSRGLSCSTSILVKTIKQMRINLPATPATPQMKENRCIALKALYMGTFSCFSFQNLRKSDHRSFCSQLTTMWVISFHTNPHSFRPTGHRLFHLLPHCPSTLVSYHWDCHYRHAVSLWLTRVTSFVSHPWVYHLLTDSP